MSLRGVSFVLFGLVSAACSSPAMVEEKGSTHSKLNAQAESLWPTEDGVAEVPVCWTEAETSPSQFQDPETPAPTAEDLEARKQWVQEVVEAEWNRRTSIHFTGWKACGKNASKMVQLVPIDSAFVENEDYVAGQPHTQALGRFARGKKAFLNTFFGDEYIYANRLEAQGKDQALLGAPGWNPAACQEEFTKVRDVESPEVMAEIMSIYRECLGNNVLHEFGHLAGFAHEQFRDDASEECRKELNLGPSDVQNIEASSRGNLPLGPFETDSIMSYCRKDNAATLTEQDVLMTNTVYGGELWGDWGPGQDGADGKDGESF